MKFNLFYNLQMVLANVLYLFTGYKLTLVHSLVQTQLPIALEHELQFSPLY